MRSTAVRLLSITAAPLLLLTACGGGSGAQAAVSLSAIKVNSAKPTAPTMTIPKGGFKAGAKTDTQVISQGTGAVVGSKQIAYIDDLAYNGTTGKKLVSTFGQRFAPIPLADTSQLPGLVKALSGKKVGTTEKVAIPPAQGFGTAGSKAIGVGPTDTLVFYIKIDSVADAITQPTGTQAAAPAGLKVVVLAGTNKEAKVTIPAGAAPTSLISQDLITGMGLKTATGDTVLASYTGVNWTTKKVFDSSSKNAPVPFQLSPTGAIPGFVKGLTGKTVGSRVVLVIPPALGYGKSGNPQAAIKGTDTLVFVVDILAIVPPPPPQQPGGAPSSGG